MSRTPVNHALGRLEREGLVCWRPNRGYQIAEIERDEAGELFELREALEAFAVERATERRTPSTMRELRQRMLAYARLGRQPLTREKLLLDRAFHMTIADIAGNKRLQEALDQVFERLILKRSIEALPGRGTTTVREHEEIFRAIARGNRRLGIDRMRAHIRNSCHNLLEHLDGKRALFGSPSTPTARRL